MNHCKNCGHYVLAHTNTSPNSKCNACVNCGRGGSMPDQCDKLRDLYSPIEQQELKCGKQNYTCNCTGWVAD